jgi:hypothetical protein
MVSLFFNLGHRHANRRGPPRGLKETETSASTFDGKTSKRGTASYGAHEVVFLVLTFMWLTAKTWFKCFSSIPNIMNGTCRNKCGFKSQVRGREFCLPMVCYSIL